MRTKIIFLSLICGLIFSGCSNSGSSQQDKATEPTSQNAEDTAKTEIGAESEPENRYPDFTGIDISDEGLAFSSLNNKVNLSKAFCCNGDMIYFSNPNDMGKLYSYDGEAAKCLTDIKVYDLNYYDGCVYFLSGSNFRDLAEDRPGAVYKYDVQSDEITQITETEGFNLYVGEQRVFYANNNFEETYPVCSCISRNAKIVLCNSDRSKYA